MTVQSSALHCIAPSEVDDDALFLVARAEAPVPVIAHVNRCPACRESVMQYQRIERLLVSALDRRSCPATLTLG
jgi:hypothetical protein